VFTFGVLTVSDKGSRGEREDESGRTIIEMCQKMPAKLVRYDIVPDERVIIEEKLREYADTPGINIIMTTGGTGVSPRDVTPEATRAVIDKELPGYAEAMRSASFKKTPYAVLSRAVAGIRGQTLIVNLPGSPRAVRENLSVILPSLVHAVDKITGDESDCGTQ